MRRIHYFDSLSSTNEVAGKMAFEGAGDGEIVLAERQTAGRGRRGATWRCPTGKGILASVILRPMHPGRTPLLSLAAALAVAEGLGATTGLPARTKWPNDVLIKGKKVAGILVEASAAGANPFAIVGIGVNVNFHLEDLVAGSDREGTAGKGDLADSLSQPATTILDELGREVDRLALLREIVERLDQYAHSIASGNPELLLAACRKADAYLGKPVEVRIVGKIDASPAALHGIYKDLAEDGSLILLTPGGQRRHLQAGEVRGLEGSELRLSASGGGRKES